METLSPSFGQERNEGHVDGKKIFEVFLDRCRQATSPEDHADTWNTMIDHVRRCSDSTIAAWVAEQVLIEWPYNALYSSHMDRLLQICGTVIATSTCCFLLKKLGNNTDTPAISTKLPPSSILEVCCATLRHQLLSKDYDWPSSPFQETKTDLQRFAKLVLSIPSLVANACHSCKVRLPLWATAEKFFSRLMDCGWSNDTPIEYRVVLIKTFLANRSNATSIAMGLAAHHPLPKSVLSASSWNDRELFNLIWAFLQHSVVISLNVESAEQVLTTCQILLKQASVDHQQAFVQNMILKPMGDIRLCPLVISLLDKCDILRSSLGELTEEWSKSSFCHHVPPSHQHFVSQLILEGMQRIPTDKDNNSTTLGDEDNLTLHLLQGVSHRLESFVPEIRLDGMRVAQLVAQRTNQELQFDELIEAEQKAASSARQNLDHSEDDSKDLLMCPLTPTGPKGESKTTRKKPKKQNQKLLDPDAEYDSDEDTKEVEISENFQNDDENDDDDASTIYEDELVPYSLEDDEEDLVMTPRPLYLLRALELLRTGEGDEYAYSHHETAMRALPALIRKRPDDLPDVAISLLMELLRIEDKFGIDNFLELRQQSLVALAVCEPVSVGKQMIESVFLDNTLSDRLACFGALQEAAYELSGSKDLDQRTLAGVQSDSLAVPSLKDGSNDVSEEQLARLQSKTRRKRSPRLAPTVVKNLFTPIAPQWFYSLTAQFLKNRDNKILWSGSTGSQLLASLIRTLAVFVEFAGIFAAPVLAKDLMDLVWSFLNADVAEVRMAVLTAMATSFLVLPEDRIMSIVSEQMDNFPQVITRMSRLDPDTSCRQLATTISQSMIEMHRPTI